MKSNGYGHNLSGGNADFYGQSKATGLYETTAWYHLQSVINEGEGMMSHNSSVVYNYQGSFILRAGSESEIYEPHVSKKNGLVQWILMIED